MVSLLPTSLLSTSLLPTSLLPTVALPTLLPPTRTYSHGCLHADFEHSAERNKMQGGEEGNHMHDRQPATIRPCASMVSNPRSSFHRTHPNGGSGAPLRGNRRIEFK